jgi:hypothetical protein
MAEKDDDEKEIVKCLEQIVELHPDSPTSQLQLAYSLLRTGDFMPAMELCNQTADRFPYSFGAQHFKAWIEELMAAAGAPSKIPRPFDYITICDPLGHEIPYNQPINRPFSRCVQRKRAKDVDSLKNIYIYSSVDSVSGYHVGGLL